MRQARSQCRGAAVSKTENPALAAMTLDLGSDPDSTA